MKTTILTALLSLTLFTNLTLGAEAPNVSEYNATARLELTYNSSGWGGSEKDSLCNEPAIGIFVGIVTLGIAPVLMCPNSHKRKIEVVDVDLKAVQTELENGRGTIRLSSTDNKDCKGLSALVYTEQDGFGGLDIYKNKEDWTNGVKIGSAVKSTNSLELTFTSDELEVSSVGKKGACVFKFGSKFYINMSKN